MGDWEVQFLRKIHGVVTGSSCIAGANPNEPRQRKFFMKNVYGIQRRA
ncbi:hypothetical protein PROFUN_10321 [Planoprotostelium fungivorum]|uniref:Uncharacterized protein n=1 Tax=Planoprotostelium fungivorum TaxID=1890364 RepID=A0A2P6NDS3_9EUKA|nr:hypothetical protein PROFUN_10321 [Planoprotostelium fungivorum]